jgi:hypothetical protein
MESNKMRFVVREVNGAISELEERFGRNGHVPVLCECGTDGCLQRLRVPSSVYDEIRADTQRFVVARGHEAQGRDRVLAGEADFFVVAPRTAAGPALAEPETA